MARVVLLSPFSRTGLQTHRFGVGHLGLGYVAAVLLHEGHEVSVIDAKNDNLSYEQIRQCVIDFRPDILGVTAMTHEIHAAARTCTDVKRAAPAVLTVVGGPHATALPERMLDEFPDIDVAVIGEGEYTAAELARALPSNDFTTIPGIAFRRENSIVRTTPRPWITDLDSVPFPAWHLFPKVTWPVIAGRGCPFGCTFCQRALGRKVRMRTTDNVIAEFDAQEANLGQRSSWFQDETFALNRKWVDELLLKMHERNARNGYVWEWKANSRANLADADLYRRMREAGCVGLDFGIESGNDEILKRIKKGITKEAARMAIQSAKEANIFANAFFIIGHPGETWRTGLETVRFAAECRPDRIAVGVMVPYPGTEVWELARRGEYGYVLLSEDWRLYDKYFGNALESRSLTHRQMELLQMLTYLWFFIYNFRLRLLAQFLVRFRRETVAMVRRLLGLGAARTRTLSWRI